MDKISTHIKKEVFQTLDSLYNYRKEKEGLVSYQNMLIKDLKKVIKEWEKKQRDSYTLQIEKTEGFI